MVKFLSFVRSRLARGRSLLAMGPNEARLAYDLAVGISGITATEVFVWGFIDGQCHLWLCVMTPFLLVAANRALGIYSRFRGARRWLKAEVLTVSALLVAGFVYWQTGSVARGALWSMLVIPAITLPRVFLGLAHEKHTGVLSFAVRREGPVLVIGGAGYIGTHVVDLLLREGRTVRVLDRLLFGRDSLSDFRDTPNFALIEGDATDIAKLTEAMNGCSAVVQLAGLVGDPACAVDDSFTRHANIIVTRMAKEVAQSLGVHRFVFASSCSVYGATDREVDESDALHPVSLYAQTKIDSERELLISIRDEFFVTVLRFATVFGHSRRQRFDLVANLFAAQAMTDGLITVTGAGQWRPFVHVRDVARAVTLVLRASPATVQSQILNVGDRRLNMNILRLAEIVKNVAGSVERSVQISVRETPGDRRNYVVSFEKIRSLLGFEALTLMEPGLGEMIEIFKQGGYGSYRDQIYNNLAVTQKALRDFQDPLQASKLYAPLEHGRPLPLQEVRR